MLTPVEKILLILAVIASAGAAYVAATRIIRTIQRGQGKFDWQIVKKRLGSVLVKTITLQPTFKIRLLPSLFHALIAWGFIYYLLVNVVDGLEGLFSNFNFFEETAFGQIYSLLADILSVAVLIGMLAMIIRRFVLKSDALTTRPDVLLQPQARAGIRRDSAVVASFIMLHVGSRFIGASLEVARKGLDDWQPFASLVSGLWSGASQNALIVGEHITFWLAIGTILLFIPYFLYSKHLHLIFAPINFLIKPERRSMGELSKLNFDDESIEQFGATHLEDLGWEQIVDAYACIMCYRCQEVCPAYNTGKVLSPATLEINKRYFLNSAGAQLAKGEQSATPLLDFAITTEAIWACTACGACVEICPVGNEPMRDILDIRRAQVLMENEFPDQLQTAFRGMERNLNPWNVPPTERLKWAEGLDVPTIDANPTPELLWWVGCAPATDSRAQKTARAFVEILNASGVNYAILGEAEQCTGDSARRAGNEFLFNELATANVEILNEVAPPRIVTTCPHCLHTLKNEYPAFGGNYQVVHHTQLIQELLAAGKLHVQPDAAANLTTFHDPCYLGRQNDILTEPRQVLKQVSPQLVEMGRTGKQSFCCGAGGAQMWKEEEAGQQRVSANRMAEAIATGADTLAVGCPFCMVMLTDAKKDANTTLEVLDIAEIVAKSIQSG